MEEKTKAKRTNPPAKKQQSSNANKPNRQKNRNKANTIGKQRSSVQKNESWYKDLQKSIEANKKIQEQRVYPMNFKASNSNDKIKITPLGGLGEIGGNMMVMETNTSAIIIDVGMSFPDDEMHGVDILVPDFSYLRSIKNKIKGIVITHAHEDHIGALPYLFKNQDLQFPIYATPLPLGMIANKFDEHKISKKFCQT